MTDADKIMHPQHLGTDPTDTRIRINPKIWIRSPDHFWFKFWRWRMFALYGCSCCFCSIFNFMFLSCIVLSACHSTWRINVSKLMVLVWFHLSWKLRNDRSNRFVEIFKLRNTRRGKLRPVAVGGGGGVGAVGRPLALRGHFQPTVSKSVWALTSWISSVYEIELIKSRRLAIIFQLWPQTNVINRYYKNRGFP